MNNLETIGLNIKWYRYQRRLTQEKLTIIYMIMKLNLIVKKIINVLNMNLTII